MITTKLAGRKKKRTAKFKNKFEELSVEEFVDFIAQEEKLGKLEDDEERLEAELKALDATQPGADNAVIFIDAELQDIKRKIRAAKVEMLGILSDNYKKNVAFMLNTQGFNDRHIIQILLKIRETLTDFNAWVQRVKPVKNFRFTDYQKPHFWSLTKVREFEVFDTDKQTVLRDSAAMMVAKKVDTINAELKANRWANLARFVAYAARPATQKEEIDVSDKKAFLYKSNLAVLSVDDRLKAYNDKLAETVDLRTPIFSKLPLVIAIGVYKQYFFLSRR